MNATILKQEFKDDESDDFDDSDSDDFAVVRNDSITGLGKM